MVTMFPEMTMAMKRWIWVALIGILLTPALASAQAEEVVYFHTDAIGSVRMITDSTGTVLARYDYTPFGQPWNPPGTVEVMQFTGKERDVQTELDYFNARDFMSLTGRFTTPDDPAYMDPFNPQSMNRYAYAYNNPFRYNDPTGHSGDCIGGYDSTTGNCLALPDFGFPWSLWNGWIQSWGTAVEVAQPVTNWFMAPRDPTCLAGSAGIGTLVGGMAGGIIGGAGGGASGAFGGTMAAPGVGTIPGGLAGGAAGFGYGTALGALAGGTFGRALGTVACMGGGPGGGGHKSPKPGVSGKEGAKDVPSWAKGQRPRVGESGRDFAKRLLDDKYGPGNYDKCPGSEFNRIQKWGDRAFQ